MDNDRNRTSGPTLSSPLRAEIDGQESPDTAQKLKGRRVKQQAAKQFDSWANSYDRSIVQTLLFQPAYRMFMEELFRWRRNDPSPIDLLDIGSGTGTWVAMVAGSPLPTGRVIGLDYSQAMCELAHAKAAQIGEGAPEFIRGDSEHLPLADGSCDVVTCSHSFHHYPHQAAVVREMRRVLRPGGRLMIIDGFRDNAIGWVLFDVFITRAESREGAPVHHPSWSQFRQHFLDAGFVRVRQEKRHIWAPILMTVGEVSS